MRHWLAGFILLFTLGMRIIHDVGDRNPLNSSELHDFAHHYEVWFKRFGMGIAGKVCITIRNGPEAALLFSHSGASMPRSIRHSRRLVGLTSNSKIFHATRLL